MELLATRDEKQIWLHQLARPYRLPEPPFPDQCYAAILLANHPSITPEEQATLSTDLVNTDCRDIVCAGLDSSSWTLAIDLAYLEKYDYSCDKNFVGTSSHQGDDIEDIIFSGLLNASCDEQEYRHYLILTIAPHPGQREEIQRAITTIWFPTPE